MIKQEQKRRIVILGGGPAGLGAAWRLKELGYKNWELYEKENVLGGHAGSFKDEKGFTWDEGPHIYFSKNDYFNNVFKKLMGRDIYKKVRRQYIWWDDVLIPYPFQNHIRYLPSDILLKCLKGIIELKDLKPNNFLEFNLASFGEGITNNFMKPYNEKVWAYPLDKMSFSWIGDKVSRIDLNKSLENVILKKDELNWGPNSYFSYPIHGGSGEFWSRFLPKLKSNIKFGSEIKRISLKEKKIYLKDGEEKKYDYLISTLPIDFLINGSDSSKQIKSFSNNLVYNSGLILGLGIRGKSPKYLEDKLALYFPQKEILFNRMVVLKKLSPYLTPTNHWSLMFEASFSKHRPVDRDDFIKTSIDFIKKRKWIKRNSDIVDIYIKQAEHFYPVPTIDRDKNLEKIQGELIKNNIYSIGRFGAWRYELGNMDHGFMMGVEAVNKILA